MEKIKLNKLGKLACLNLKKISLSDKQSLIAEKIAELEGAVIGYVDMVTTPELLGGKKNPMKGKVQKYAIGAGIVIGAKNYEKVVNERLVAEGKPPIFEASELPWGKRVGDSPFIINKDETYIQVRYLSPPQKVIYVYDGKVIPKDEVIGLKPSSNGKQGGLSEENKIPIRTPKLESFQAIRMGKFLSWDETFKAFKE